MRTSWGSHVLDTLMETSMNTNIHSAARRNKPLVTVLKHSCFSYSPCFPPPSFLYPAAGISVYSNRKHTKTWVMLMLLAQGTVLWKTHCSRPSLRECEGPEGQTPALLDITTPFTKAGGMTTWVFPFFKVSPIQENRLCQHCSMCSNSLLHQARSLFLAQHFQQAWYTLQKLLPTGNGWPVLWVPPKPPKDRDKKDIGLCGNN